MENHDEEGLAPAEEPTDDGEAEEVGFPADEIAPPAEEEGTAEEPAWELVGTDEPRALLIPLEGGLLEGG